MEFNLLHIFTLLCVVVAVVASHAAITSQEAYWKSVLPNTPMPKAVMELLHPEWMDKKSIRKQKQGTQVNEREKIMDINIKYRIYAKGGNKSKVYNAATLDDDLKAAPFFLEKDMHGGAYINVHFSKSPSTSTFLPRQEAELIPFASNKLPEILNKFSVKPNSLKAEMMKTTISACEDLAIKGEEKYCATSLESMIDFSTSKLGNKIQAISTETTKETHFQKYIITGVKKMAGGKSVVCHKQNYAYAVYYCHKILRTTPYMVSLVADDGTKVKAVVVCHADTTTWDTEHVAFQVLKVKPGSVPICHYLLMDTVVWVPY